MTAPQQEPRDEVVCSLCGTPVTPNQPRCPACGLSRPGARGSGVLGKNGLWLLAAALLVVYAIVFAIVAAAR